MSGQTELVGELKKQTELFSIAALMADTPAFKNVLLQGERIIPAILSELKENGPDRGLFLALEKLATNQPKLPIIPGDLNQIKNIWLQWGQEKGYLFNASRCCGKELVWTKFSADWQNHSMEGSYCPICKTIRERKNGQVVYTKKNAVYTCQCGAEVLAAEVFHPIHDGPFPLSGSGRVKKEIVPFCPKCEEKPSSSGKIITP